MKRWIALFLILALMLAGCAKKQPDTEQTQPTAVTPQPTEPGLYAPGSDVEKQTAGAVRSYGLEDGEWFGLSSVGADLLVTGKNAILLISGQEGFATRADVAALSVDTEMDTHTTGIGYYDPKSRTVTVLDAKLQQVTQKVLPEEIVGAPVISMIRNEAYY